MVTTEEMSDPPLSLSTEQRWTNPLNFKPPPLPSPHTYTLAQYIWKRGVLSANQCCQKQPTGPTKTIQMLVLCGFLQPEVCLTFQRLFWGSLNKWFGKSLKSRKAKAAKRDIFSLWYTSCKVWHFLNLGIAKGGRGVWPIPRLFAGFDMIWYDRIG